MGLPVPGKATFARALVKSANGKASVVSSDDIGEEMFSFEFIPSNDDVVFAVRDSRLRSVLRTGRAAIADSTNVTPEARERLLRLAKEEGVSSTALLFPTSSERAQKVDVGRGRDAGYTDRFFAYMASITPESLKSEGFDKVADVSGEEQGFAPAEAARLFQITFDS